MVRQFSGAIAIALLLAGSSLLSAQPPDPPDRLEVASASDVVALIAAQTEVMQEMSEKLARIETIVSDTNEKVATSADVQAILSKLESMKLNTGSSITERIIAIDGVPIASSDPCATLAAPVATSSPPAALPYTIKTSRPFNRSSVTIDPNTGQSAVNIKTPFQRIQTSTPSLPTPELPSRPNLPGCLGGRCDIGPTTAAYGSYSPPGVSSPPNDLGRSTRRFRLFPRLFGGRR